MRRSLAVLAGLAGASLALMAQIPQPPRAAAAFDAVQASLAIEKLAASLEERFVFPDIGKKYAAALRAKLARGGYSNFPEAGAFSDAVTADLQAVHEDRHLKVRPVPPEGAGGQRLMGPPPDFQAIGKTGWVADGIAYISFAGFPGNEPTLAKLKAFLVDHEDAKALIIDARGHRGGGLDEMDLMFPHLFAEPQTLVQMDTRIAVDEAGGNAFDDGATLVKVPGQEGVVRRSHKVIPAAGDSGLKTAKIFLLTSSRTASAAEHLALSLKRTRRATLIGETTKGAGHYGGIVQLGGGYAAFIPVGRTFDPDTGQGWEGTGVKPHVEVPAERALEEALRRAGVDAAKVKALASFSRRASAMRRRLLSMP